MAPFAKTGGLADVAGSLPAALGDLGVEVLVMMPRYRGLPSADIKISKKVRVRFIHHEAYFNRSALYGNPDGDYSDNLQRFSFFCHEILRQSEAMGFCPDIIHAHDWQTSLVPVLLKTEMPGRHFFKKTKTLLTIHNAAYQGIFSHRRYADLGLSNDLFHVDGLEFFGRINLLKGGILFADAISTVSPTYAKEIQTRNYGFWLEGVLKKRASDLRGILNGIDEKLWNPATDKRIKKKYSIKSLAGKAVCKADLQERLGLEKDADIPVFGMVTRLAEQKGLDLMAEIADEFLKKNIQFVLLGDGDRVYHTTFSNIGKRHPKKAAIHLGFNADEAHRIYAGSDFFLMPSSYEPCGLGQLISLRYGTLPIVRKTGGLADTIVDQDGNSTQGNGFVFEEQNARKFIGAIDRALTVFKNKKRLEALKKRGMAMDVSWQKSAAEYKKLFKELLKS